MRKYFLKEYGSWGVMTISYLTGIAVSRSFDPRALGLFIALALYINSKQALTLWTRSTDLRALKDPAAFLVQVIAATAILLPLLGRDMAGFLPYAIIPVLYMVLNRFAGEHALATEVAGFLLLTISALMSNFVVTFRIDPVLYTATAAFFTAGVFKVRVQLRKRLLYRAVMLLYLVFAVDLYYFLHLPLVALIPLFDNLLFAATLYKVKLRTAGWIEVTKGLAFLISMAFFYQS